MGTDHRAEPKEPRLIISISRRSLRSIESEKHRLPSPQGSPRCGRHLSVVCSFGSNPQMKDGCHCVSRTRLETVVECRAPGPDSLLRPTLVGYVGMVACPSVPRRKVNTALRRLVGKKRSGFYPKQYTPGRDLTFLWVPASPRPSFGRASSLCLLCAYRYESLEPERRRSAAFEDHPGHCLPGTLHPRSVISRVKRTKATQLMSNKDLS